MRDGDVKRHSAARLVASGVIASTLIFLASVASNAATRPSRATTNSQSQFCLPSNAVKCQSEAGRAGSQTVYFFGTVEFTDPLQRVAIAQSELGQCRSMTVKISVTKGESAHFELINSPQRVRRMFVPVDTSTTYVFKLNRKAWKLDGWGMAGSEVARLDFMMECTFN
jgi:hypothetical protein